MLNRLWALIAGNTLTISNGAVNGIIIKEADIKAGTPRALPRSIRARALIRLRLSRLDLRLKKKKQTKMRVIFFFNGRREMKRDSTGK